MEPITIQSLLTADEVDLYRSCELTAVVAGDGLDYGMFLFDADQNVINADECGFSTGFPYVSARDYLLAYQKGITSLQDMLSI